MMCEEIMEPGQHINEAEDMCEEIMEPGQHINEAEDFTVNFQCGCEVTFLGSCLHRSSRMLSCAEHGTRQAIKARDKLYEHAVIELERAKRAQPPL